MLWRLGLGKVVYRLWEMPPTLALYDEELDGFSSWFSVSMAASPWKGHVRTKRGSGQRVVPRRERKQPAGGGSSAGPARAHTPTVGCEFMTAKVNQQRPIVANALLASYEAKALLVAILGKGATSLGSTGVERGWWLHHVHNTNKTGVWATNAFRQFRAVVVWKREVRASLRRRLECVAGTGDHGHNQQAQALAEECDALAEVFAGGTRPQVLLANATPEEPASTELNVGLDEFRKQLVQAGVVL